MESKGRRALRGTVIGAASPEADVDPEHPAEAVKPIEEQAQQETSAGIPVPGVGAIAEPSEKRQSQSRSPRGFSDILSDFGRQNFAAFVDSQTALARGLETLSAEISGLVLSGIDTAAQTATDMLAVKTLSDAFAVNAGFTRRSFDALVAGSAKLSELGVKVATEASQPILKQFGKGWTTTGCSAFRPA